jgi:hypothetical protein
MSPEEPTLFCLIVLPRVQGPKKRLLHFLSRDRNTMLTII